MKCGLMKFLTLYLIRKRMFKDFLKNFSQPLLNFENVVYNGILLCMFRLRYTVYIYIEMKKIRKTNIDRMKNIGKGIHMLSTDIGVDLGTASILVYIKGKGVVLKEPSVVAFDRDTNKIKAIGEEARLMLGRTPGNIVAVRPLRQGVISDYRVTEKC